MPFPNYEGKHAHAALFSPTDFLAHMREHGQLPDLESPSGALLVYQRSAAQHLLQERRAPDIDLELIGSVAVLNRDGGRAALGYGFGIGAPAATVAAECLIAWGVRRILSVGLAGGLQPSDRIGEIVVCDAAIRDEGVSHHYVAPAAEALPSATLTDHLRDELRRRGVTFHDGSSWTVDAPYRETVAEARHYRARGVRTVEMEAAALFAVGAYRGVDVAAAFVISDSLGEEQWSPQFFAGDTRERLNLLAEAAVSALIT